MLITNGYTHKEEIQTSNGNGFARWIVILLFILAVGSIIMSSSDSNELNKTEEKKDEGKENLRLDRYKKSKPKRNTEQWKDYCTLKKKIEKVIDPSCFCDCKEDNSFWFNPPKNGELGDEWELLSEVYSEGGSKHFKNKRTGEIVRFDKKHKENGVDHYHRYNLEIKELIDRRKFKNENMYLDICGNVLRHNLNEKNHIIVIDSSEYEIKNEESCNE